MIPLESQYLSDYSMDQTSFSYINTFKIHKGGERKLNRRNLDYPLSFFCLEKVDFINQLVGFQSSLIKLAISFV
jgi:hypothetical protein